MPRLKDLAEPNLAGLPVRWNRIGPPSPLRVHSVDVQTPHGRLVYNILITRKMNSMPAQLSARYETLRRAVLNNDRDTLHAATCEAVQTGDRTTLEFLAAERNVQKAAQAEGTAPAEPERPPTLTATALGSVIARAASTDHPEGAGAGSERSGRVLLDERTTASPQQFFDRVLPSTGPYCLFTGTTGADGKLAEQRHYNGIKTIAELEALVQKLRQIPVNVFYATGNYANKNRRDPIAKRSLYLDLDGKDFGSIPDALRALLVFVKSAGLPPPSIFVHSGRGVHVYWALDRDVPIDEWLPVAKALKGKCKELGFAADPTATADPARILRCPGTLNRKAAEPLVCRVLSDNGTTTSIEAIAEVLSVNAQASTTPVSKFAGLVGADDLATRREFAKLSEDDVRDMLEFVSLPPASGRDDWITVLNAIQDWGQKSPESFEVFHDWSASQPGYVDRHDCWKIWDSFEPGGGVTVATLVKKATEAGWARAALVGPQSADSDALPTPPTTPAQRFTTEADSLEYLIARYIWVRGLGKYLDRVNGAFVSSAEIDTAESRWMMGRSPTYVPIKPSVLLRQSQRALIADALGYRFGAPALYEEHIGNHELTFANTAVPYRVDPIPPTPEEMALLDTYFSHLFTGCDGPLARTFVLDAIAYLVQNPQQRWRFGILFAGTPGCGKGVLFQQITTLLFGPGNIGETNIEELARGFSGSLTGKLIRVADEVRQSFVRDGEKLFNTWKPYITNDFVSVQRKGVDSHDVHNATSHAGLTNYPLDAGYFQDNDRRWFVFASDAPRMDTLPWTDTFFAFLRSDRAARVLMHFFMQRDVSAFNPFRSPPMTAAKRQMIDSSVDDATAEVQEMFHAQVPPFHRDLFSLDDLRTELGARVRRFESIGLKKLSAIVKAEPINASPLPYKRRIGPPGRPGNPRNLWVWRHASAWNAATNEEIFEHLHKGTPALQVVTEAVNEHEPAATEEST